jgi:hypothetical protein
MYYFTNGVVNFYIALAYYNASVVVAVNSKVVGLTLALPLCRINHPEKPEVVEKLPEVADDASGSGDLATTKKKTKRLFCTHCRFQGSILRNSISAKNFFLQKFMYSSLNCCICKA